MSGCLSLMCASTLVTSSSSVSPRTVSPQGQSTFIAMTPPLGCRILRRWDLDSERGECLLGRFLLGLLLRLARPDAELLALDHGGAREAPVVRRAFHLQDAVAHGLPAARKRLLQLRLVVDVARQRIV